jgi:Tfp pilus assembly protein PilW
MNLRPSRSFPGRAAAFTLTELMLTMAVVLLFMAGILSAHVFGLRLFEFTRAKLGASNDARRALNLMMDEIRSAKTLKIGAGSLAAFSEIPANTPQRGNAVQIHPTTNAGAFVRYFWDAADQKVKRMTNGAAAATVVASAVSNQFVFTAEDFAGNLLTNNANNRVIGLKLQFLQLQYPAVTIGPGSLFDYYQLNTKITRRAIE